MSIKGNTKGQIFNEINITPLTDIFLVLLIIMMVVAPLLDQQGLKLAVPQIGAPPDKKQENKYITVDISQTGEIGVEGKVVKQDSLIYSITDLKKIKADGLVIRAHDNAVHEDVVFVMDTARNAGIENISIMSQQ